MREIKFRSAFFDFKGNFTCFAYWGMLNHKDEYDERCFKGVSSVNNSIREADDQYTGIKDKTGRERYEHDLYEIRVNGIETHVEDIICKVEWSVIVGGFGFQRISPDSEQPDWIGMTDKNILSLKHIGNIYENPELLNEAFL